MTDRLSPPPGSGIVMLLQRAVLALATIVLFIAGLVFASVIFVAAALLALGVWIWIWWRLRRLRRAAPPGAGGAPTIIEGEYRVERESTEQVPPPSDRDSR